MASYEMLLLEPGVMPTCEQASGSAASISATTNSAGVATGVFVS